jgi:hypothetical protein
MDVAKQIAVSVLAWIATGILAWVGSKLPKIREWFSKNQYAKTVTIALVLSGLLSTIVTIVYTNYRTDNVGGNIDTLQIQLGKWGDDKPGNRVGTNGGFGPIMSTCPDGYYAVGITNWGNRSGQCIGCFNEVQLLCRKLNV